MKRASELEFLRWFYANADFGPAEEDVRFALQEGFIHETGLNVPKDYECYDGAEE